MRHRFKAALASIALVAATVFVAGDVQATGRVQQYRVTIQNLSAGQPMSPPVLATFSGDGARAFVVGGLASAEMEEIAENGNQIPQFDKWSADSRVTDVVDVGMPLTPAGSTAGGFSDTVSVDIMGRQGEDISIATLLICTNDGIVGVSRTALPRRGSKVILSNAYDAGTEDNTELSADLVDPCSGIGPAPLAGDPNMNENAAVDSAPHSPIGAHPGIAGGGDLDPALHGIANPVMKVTITRVDSAGTRWIANLTGAAEVPSVATSASGTVLFDLKANGVVEYEIQLTGATGVTQAHIHDGDPNENGPVMVFLFGFTDPTGRLTGRLIKGTFVPGHLVGAFAGDMAAFLTALRNGELYVNLQTASNPGR